MKSKQQKSKEIESGKDLLGKNQTVVFADFTGTAFEDLKRLKSELKKVGGVFKVVKKRLLKIAFQKQGIEFDPTQFESQVGSVFLKGELTSAASTVYKFQKDLTKAKKPFKVLGAYEIPKKNFLNAEQFLVIAKLPSREVLLGQVLGMFTAPLRSFMMIVDQLSKRGGTQSEQKVAT